VPAPPIPTLPITDGDDSLLTFTVAGQAMAMAAAELAEVARVPPCTRIPNAPASLFGVANVRGRVMPVISLAALLGEDAGQSAAASGGAAARLLVLAGGAPVGLVVDAVASLGRGEAARRLDPRALLARDYAVLRRHAAVPVPAMPMRPEIEPEGAEDRLALVALRLGAQDYALPLDQVDRVMRPPDALTQVPHRDDAMLGTIAFEGGLLPVVSLAVLLGLPPSDAAEGSARILVASLAGQRVGLLVDRVTGTITVRRDRIDAVPALLTRGAAEAQIQGICRLDGGQRLVCLLSTANLFDARTTDMIRSNDQKEPLRMPAAADAAGAREAFVIFRLGEEAYGLPIAAVHEVARYPEHLARVPDAPDFVAGIMSLRGRAVPVIDTARRFGAAVGDHRSRRVIVVSTGGVTAGLAVDAVTDVLSFPAEALQPAPEFQADATIFDRIAVRSADRMILLISPKAVIEAAERDLLAALAQAAQAKLPPVL
jgi:purine-binding chemotaxis protein CheW